MLPHFGGNREGGLEHAALAWTRALIASKAEHSFTVFVKKKNQAPPIFEGSKWTIKDGGGVFFWRDRIAKSHPDINIWFFYTPILPFFVRPKISITCILDLAYLNFPATSLREYLQARILKWLHKRSLQRADGIVAISHATKNDTIEKLHIPDKKIKVIHLGVTSRCAVDAKQLQGIPDAPFFFFIGVFKERKNVHGIVNAFCAFAKNKKNSMHHLVLAGRCEGSYGARIKDMIVADPLLRARIHIMRFLNDAELAFCYRHATALVFPSLLEGFGFPVLEAMECGLPVITSSTTSLGELAGDAALLVDPKKPQEIADAMDCFASDESLRNAYQRKGYERVQQFSWDRAGAELIAYLEVVYQHIQST